MQILNPLHIQHALLLKIAWGFIEAIKQSDVIKRATWGPRSKSI